MPDAFACGAAALRTNRSAHRSALRAAVCVIYRLFYHTHKSPFVLPTYLSPTGQCLAVCQRAWTIVHWQQPLLMSVTASLRNCESWEGGWQGCGEPVSATAVCRTNPPSLTANGRSHTQLRWPGCQGFLTLQFGLALQRPVQGAEGQPDRRSRDRNGLEGGQPPWTATLDSHLGQPPWTATSDSHLGQ